MGAKYTPAQKKATDKYLKTLANISIKIPHTEYSKYKDFATKNNMSLREFVLKSMEEKIEREEKPD